MTVEKYLTYRGEIKAAVAVGGTLAFVTAHPAGQPTGLYRLDADTLTLDLDPLPAGASALAADGPTLWAAGTDGRVYEGSAAGGTPRAVGPAFDPAPTALALLADGRLAVLSGSRVLVLNRKDGKALQTLDLPEPGACLAADPTGHWLAAGTTRGTLAVFDDEGKPGFLLSASERLHEGAVSALLFEPDELRVFSTGADNTLLSTHARGRLEPEDKARGNAHSDLVTALTWGPGDRLYSGGRDGAIKSWPRTGAVKPATTRDGVGRVVALALVLVHDRPRLAAACDDNTVRFFAVDAAGKIGDATHRAYDAHARAKHELSQQDDPARREAALRALAAYGDARSLDLIADQAQADADHALRLTAARLLGASDQPRAMTRLEACLGHRDEAVRVAAFGGLRRQRGEADLRPIDLALKAEKADVGRLAVAALEGLAAGDDQALARLTQALDAKTPEVRQAATVALEAAHGPRSPEPNLVALGSKHADVRRSALVRLYRRDLLDDPAVQSALRRRSGDPDAEVRRTAFLLSLHTRPRLLGALRARDPDLRRQLAELEGTPAEPAPAEPPGKAKPKEKPKKAKPAKAAPAEAIEDADLDPLLQATAARALDTCLRGGRGLALLGDPRAFGLLLQLSREEDKAARAEVCRALAALDDPRAVERLRSLLHDAEAEVRDAAFTALAGLHQSDPLLAVEAGLNASHEDVRSRGLQALTAAARKAPESPAALRLLARALNDSFPAVRAEAFKAALGLPSASAGGAAGNLRLAAGSVHADVRRGVLTEAMARVGEPGGWDLLLGFFNDPDPAVRDDAFAFAVKKTRGLEFLEAGLGSRHPDLRRRSVDALVKTHTAASQALLVRAIADDDRGVRLAALESLVDADALPALRDALGNAHHDVRLRAAKALARHGDPAALGPLVALATAPEPVEAERRGDWLKLTSSALDGLGELGDPAALPAVVPALDSPHAALRAHAARALAWVCPPGATDALRLALQHADPEVKSLAALGLAYAGDASVSSLVFSVAAGKVQGLAERVTAAIALGPSGEDRLVVYLDEPNDEARARALLVLMMREWKDPQASPSRCLACLASRFPRFRLIAARALESLPDPAAFAAFVAGLVNDRGDAAPPWKIPAATVDALAELLVHAGPQLRARTALLLHHLNTDEPDAFEQAWSAHAARFAGELADLRRRSQTRTPVPPDETPAGLRELAFGAYVGLVREQGDSARKKKTDAGADPQVVRVRQTALGRLLALAGADARHAAAVRPVFVQAMGDPNQAVRVQAFEQARAVGMADAALAAEALSGAHTDLGVRGLELLTGGASEAEGRAVLERAMLTRKDELAVEAARLLNARPGAAGVAARALDAAHEPLRTLAVSWLGAAYDKEPAAREALRGALGSRHRAVREAAAFELAGKKDPAAFDALVTLLNGATLPHPQKRAAEALEASGDPRAPGALLARVENDPGGTAAADDLLRAVGRSRRPEVADHLLALWETQPKRREGVFAALLTVSGFDQLVMDPDDERPDAAWEAEQFPRDVGVLARLLDRVSAPAEVRYLTRLLPSARWARGKAVDPVLAGLLNHPDAAARREAFRAVGWRLRTRGGDPEPLRKALRHRDPVTQYLAAEGLARAGHADGLNVLLAALDFATDLDDRRGAVVALGVLADERALDALLKLAAEDGHPLQEAAAEAIGHMGRSARADQIFKALDRLARADSPVDDAALHGLRWFNARAGWQVIRSRAADPTYPYQFTAVELLGHNDDPATRDVLLKLLAGWDFPGVDTAMTAARRLWGPDSLEPDYAVLKNRDADSTGGFDETLARVRDRGEPGRVFEILPACGDEVRRALATGLLGRPGLPVAEARSALDSPDPATAAVAAHVLGRAGSGAVAGASDSGPALEAAFLRRRAAWAESRKASGADPDEGPRQVTPLAACVRTMVWAAGRLGVAREALAGIATATPDGPDAEPIRLEAVMALAGGEMTAEVAAALEAAALGGGPEVRAAAAQALGKGDPKRAASLAGPLLSDRVGFRRLMLGGGVGITVGAGATLRDAARGVHSQALVLPGLIDRGDLTTLAAVATDRTLPEAARLGGFEGLAALAIVPAEDALLRIGTDPVEDEELRKAALRGLKRSRRARRKAAAAATAGATAATKGEVSP